MALTSSTMLELGTPAPDFQLLDVVSHQTISLETFASQKVLLVMFICRHCPFVRHIQYELARLGKDYGYKSVGIVAISANDASVHSQDSPESLLQMAQALEFTWLAWYITVASRAVEASISVLEVKLIGDSDRETAGFA